MSSYLSSILVVSSATAVLALGCGGTADPSGSGGSSTSASATTGAGGPTSSATGAGGSGDLGPFACSGAAVGYAADVAPIFNGCSGGDTCHALATGFHSPEASYKYLVGQPSFGCSDGRLLVAPGDPTHSYLVNKLTNHELCMGEPMPRPLGASPWKPRSTAQIQAIYDWICTGAKND
jgi:hypothetical protein